MGQKNVTITGAYSVQYSGIPEYFMEEILNKIINDLSRLESISTQIPMVVHTKCTYLRTVGNRLLVRQ